MSTAKKAMLAVLLALTTVCAAVCSLLLAGSVSARAETPGSSASAPLADEGDVQIPTDVVLEPFSDGTTFNSVMGETMIQGQLRGSIYFNTSETPDSLDLHKNDPGYKANIPDLRPTAEEAATGAPYERKVSVSYTLNGITETSEEITVMIEWIQPVNILYVTPQDFLLTAGTDIDADAFSVVINYGTGIRTLAPGEFTYRYQNGDTLSYNDEWVEILYTEENYTLPPYRYEFGSTITISEEPVNAPMLSTLDNRDKVYQSTPLKWTYTGYNSDISSLDLDERMESSVSGTELTVQATDAGKYTVTFHVKTGYRYLSSSIPSYAKPIYRDDDSGSDVIVGVTYTLTIAQEDITSVTFDMPETSWFYDGTSAGHEPDPASIVAKGVGLEAGSGSIDLSSAGTASNGKVKITWEYRVKGSEVLLGNEMPTDAGRYQVRPVLSDLKNYNDSDGLNNWVDFEIKSAEVALPTLVEDSFPYANERIEPSINHGIDSWSEIYSVTNAGGFNKGNYTVVFTLKNPKNYHWATPGDGEISGDNNEIYTLTWEITQAQNSVEGTPSVPSWIYNEDGIQGDDVKPQIDVHFKNGDDAPAYHYAYRGWGASDYTDITAEVKADDWVWNAGDYQVWITYSEDTSGNGNFAAFTSGRYNFTVFRMFVEKPKALSGSSFVYDGTEQNISGYIPGYADNQSRYTLAGETGTEAGEYTVTLTLGANYQWGTGTSDTVASDDDVKDVSFGWKITRKVIAKPSLPDGGITVYDPAAPNTITVADYLAEAMTLSGDESRLSIAGGIVTALGSNGVIAGDYTIKVTFNKNYCYAAEDSENFGGPLSFELSWTIQRLGVAKPEVAKEFTYDGDAHNYELPKDFVAYSVVSDAQTNAGKYDVVFKLNSNYCWDESGSGVTGNHTLPEGLIIWRAATVDQPTMDESATDYNGEEQSKTVTGYDGSKMGVALDDMVNSAFDGRLFTATNAGEYTIKFSITDNNYTWSKDGQADPTLDSASVQFTWKINRIQNVIEYPDTKPSFNGWEYGTTPEDPATVMRATAKYDGTPVTYAFYAADGDSLTPIDLAKNSPVGDYVLRVSIGRGENTDEIHEDFAFKITQGQAVIEGIDLAGQDSWTFGDPLEDHTLTYTVRVNDLEIKVDPATQVQYFTSGWDGGDGADWGDPVEDFNQYSNAGHYKIVITIKDAAGNYSTEEETVTFTINKFKVAVPDYTRTNSFKENVSWKPEILEAGERNAAWTVVFETPDSTARNIYWAFLELKNKLNYEWDSSTFVPDDDGSNADQLIEDGKVKVWYRITYAEYTQMNLRLDKTKWIYGDAPANVSFGKPGDVLDEDITITFTGTLADGTEIESIQGKYTEIAAKWPRNAGSYTLVVTIPTSESYEACRGTVTFTIGKANITLTAKAGATAIYGTPATGINWNWDGDNDPLDNFELAKGQYFYDDENNLAEVFKGVTFIFSAVDYDIGYPVSLYAVRMRAEGEAANYTIDFEDAADALKITPRELTGNFDLPSGDELTYSGIAITAEYVASNLVGSDALSFTYEYFIKGEDGSFTSLGVGVEPVGVGEYKVKATLKEEGTAWSNYDFTGGAESGTYIVVPKVLNPDWDEKSLSHTYGDENRNAAVSFDGQYGVGDDYNKLGIEWLYTGEGYSGADAPVNAGTYTVSITLGNKNYCFGGEAGDYDYTAENTNYVIGKAELILRVKGVSVTYGDEIDVEKYGFEVDGLTNGDGEDVLGEVPAGWYWAGVDGDPYAPGTAAGDGYIVTIVHEFTLANYTVKEIVPGKLTVEQRALTVTITAPDQTYTGGRLEPTISLGNLFAGDVRREEAFYIDTYMKDGKAADPIDAGNYTVTVALSEEGSKNYSINEETSTLSEEYKILKADIREVSIDSPTLPYIGAEYDIEKKTGANVVLVNDRDEIGVQWFFSLVKDDFSDPIKSLIDVAEDGEYTVYYKVTAPNHNDETGEITFTITRATLTLTPDKAEAVYGTSADEIIAKLTYSGSGLVGRDVGYLETVLNNGGVVLTFGLGSYAAGSEYGSVGHYTITLESSVANVDNYIIVTPDATGENGLTITARPIVVHIDYKEAEYTTTAELMKGMLSSFALEAGEGHYGLFEGDDPAQIWSLSILTADGSEISDIPDAGTYHIRGVPLNGDGELGRNYFITFLGQKEENGGYTNTHEGAAYFVISQKVLSFSWQHGGTGESERDYLVYDNTSKTFTIDTNDTVTFGITYTYTGKSNSGVDYGPTTGVGPTDAGEYTVKATIDESAAGNYLLAESSRNFEITRATYEWEDTVVKGGLVATDHTGTITGTSVMYNGALFTYALKEALEIQPGLDGVEIGITPGIEGDKELRNADTYTCYTVLTIESGNYRFANGSLTKRIETDITIAPYNLTSDEITWQEGGACTFVYNGEDRLTAGDVIATYIPFDQDGSRTGDPVRVSVGLLGGGEFKNVGNNYNLVVTGVKDGNYTFSTNTLMQRYSITPYAVEIKVQDYKVEIQYGESLTDIPFDWEFVSGEAEFAKKDLESLTFLYGTCNANGGSVGQGVDVGRYYAYILRITGDNLDVLNNYTINGYAGGQWAEWTDSPDWRGEFEIVLREVSLTGENVTVPENATYTGKAYAVTVNSLTNVYADDLDYLEFIITYTGTGDTSFGPTEDEPVYDGSYTAVITLALAAEGNKNGNYTLAENSFPFTIGLAELQNVTAEGNTVEFNNVAYFFLETDKEGAANTQLLLKSHTAEAQGEQTVTWTFSLTSGSFDEPLKSLREVNDTDGNPETVDSYTVYYRVSAPHHETVEGEQCFFTVKIDRADNGWTKDYAHSGWAYKGIDGDPVNPAFTGLTPNTAPEVKFGDVGDIIYEYYETRTGEAGSYMYSGLIENPEEFFNNNTDAGTYYVKLILPGTENYRELVYDAAIVVEKHMLDLKWDEESLTADSEETVNTIQNYDPAVMDFSTSINGLVIIEGETTLTAAIIRQIGTYGAIIRLLDADNYRWDDDIVDSSNPENCRVTFEVKELENEVHIRISASWTYGDIVTTEIIVGETAGGNETISVAVSSMLGGSDANVVLGFAKDDGRPQESLRYSTEIPTDAGDYWIRVIARGEEAYGTGTGYAQFTILKRALDKPDDTARSSFTYSGETWTYIPEFGDGFSVAETGNNVMFKLPNETTELVASLTGNAYIDAGEYVANVTLLDTDNYYWSGSESNVLTFEWSIGKAPLTVPVFKQVGDNGGGTELNTVYDPEVASWVLDGFNTVTMGIAKMSDATYSVNEEGEHVIVASDAGTHTLEVYIKLSPSGACNYYWDGRGDSENILFTWNISKVVYSITDEFCQEYGITFADAEKTYNGDEQTIELALSGTLPAGLGVRYSGSARNVSDGSVPVTATFYATNGNYEVDSRNNTLTAHITILPQVLTAGDIIWADGTFVYTSADQTGSIYAEFIGADGITYLVPVRIDSYEAFAGGGTAELFQNAGTYIFVPDGEKFSNANFTLPDDAEKEYVIARREISLYISDQSAVYNGQPHAATTEADDYLAVGGPYADFVEAIRLGLSWRGAGAGNGSENFVDAGKYDIVLTDASENALEVNYDVTVVAIGEFTVERAQLSVEVDESGHTYGDSALGEWNHEIEGEIFPGDEDRVFTLALSEPAQQSDGGLYIADAGVFYIEYQLGDRAFNYEITFNGVLAETSKGNAAEYVVSPREVTVRVTAPDGLVYTGEKVQAATFTDDLLERDKGKYIVLTYAGTSFKGDPYSGTDTPVDAGNYTVTAALSADCTNYVLSAESFLTDGFAVAKASVATPEQTNDLYYNADVQEPVFAEDSLYSHGEIESKTDAGTYYVQFTLTNEYNYAWAEGNGSASLEVAWTIRQATEDQFTVVWGEMSGWQYDGAAHTPNGTVTIEFTNGKTVKLSTSSYRYQYALADSGAYGTEPYANVGDYLVRVYVFETSNYVAKISDAVSYTVTPAVYDLSGIAFEDGSGVYNGSAHIHAVTGNLPVGADGIAVQVTYSYAIGDAPYASMTDAGVYTVTATFTTASGNYVFESEAEELQMTAQYTVAQASAQISWNIEGGFEYDGEEHSYSATYRNVFGEDVGLTVTLTAGGAAYKDAGDYTFTAKFATEDEARNYSLNEDTAERSILVRTVSVRFGSTSFTYDGTAKRVSAELTDEVALKDGVTVSLIYSGTPFGDRTFATGSAAPSMAGNYTATAALGNTNGNFVLAGGTQSFTIAKARVSVPEIGSKPFNNETQAAEVPENELYTVSKNEGGKDVGVYTVELLLVNADDYLWYDGAECDGADYAAQWNIRQAVYGEDYTIENPVYDGEYVYDNTGKAPTEHASVVFATGSTPIVGSGEYDPLTTPIRYAYAMVENEEDVPATGDFIYDRPVNAGIYKVVAFVPATLNYTEGYNLDDMSVLIIEKAEYDMTGVSLESGASFTYDGTAHAPSLVGTLPTGLDNVRVEAGEYTFVKDGETVGSAVNAGTYTATLSFTTSSPNYYAPEPISAEFTVETRVLTAEDVLWETGSFTYNGTDQIGAVRAYFLNIEGDKVWLEVGIESYIPVGETSTLADTVQFLNAGTYEFAVQETNSGNYVFDSDERITLVMGRSEITVEIGALSGKYSGAEPSDVGTITVTVTSEDSYFNNDDLGVILEKDAGVTVGSYAVFIAEWGNTNYIITNAGSARGSYTIEPKPITVGVSANAGLVYDGTQKAASWTIDPGEFVDGEGLDDVTVTLVYSGTENSGEEWYGAQAPVNAGQYTVSVRLTSENYELDSAVQPLGFTISRAKLALPTLADSGLQNISSVETGEWETVTLEGYDSRLMGILSSGMVNMTVDAEGKVSLLANDVGTYNISVYLKDTNNYEWAEQSSEPGTPAVANISLSWTVEDAAESMVWLIVTLSVILAAEIVLLAVAIRRGKKNNGGDGTDEDDGGDGGNGGDGEEAPADGAAGEEPAGAAGEAPAGEEPAGGEPAADAGEAAAAPAVSAAPRPVKAYSFAPLAMLLFVPVGQIGAIAALGAACVVFAVCDIVAFVRSGKKAKEEPVQEQPAEEPLPEPIAEPVAEPEPEPVAEIAEEPVPEPLPEPEPEPVPVAEAAEDDEDENAFALIGADGKVLIRYDYSFRAKLIQASAEVQDWYGELSDEFLSYAKVKSAESWKQVRFYKGRIPLAIALFKGKKLCIAFALDPNDYEDTKYHGENMSDVKRFAKTPMLLRITSRRRVGYAKYLFAQLAEKYGFIKNEPTPTEHFLPYEPTEQLIEEKLVKVLASDDISDLTQVVKADVGDIIQGDIEMRAVSVPGAEDEVAADSAADEDDDSDLMVFGDDDEEESDMILADTGNGITKILVRYNYSFRARLIQSSAEVQSYYGQLINEISAYSGLKTKISWRQERVYSGRKTVAYMLFKGKKLCIAFALDPAEYSETKYRGLDMSNVRRFEKTPMLLKVVSERKVRYAKYLLSRACEKFGLEKTGEAPDTEFSLPYRTTPELIADSLVKVMSSGEGGESIPMEQADISALIRDRITMREAQMAITDEMAESLVEEIGGEQEPAKEAPTADLQAEEVPAADDAAETAEAAAPAVETTATGEAVPGTMPPPSAPVRREAVRREPASAGKGKRGIVNIDSLSRAFAPNDVVNLETLRKKKIVSPKVSSVKVLARGVLDKPLIVEANDFSMDAVKMILLTGGKVRRIR